MTSDPHRFMNQVYLKGSAAISTAGVGAADARVGDRIATKVLSFGCGMPRVSPDRCLGKVVNEITA